MIVGSQPRNALDVDHLAAEGVTTILNLQQVRLCFFCLSVCGWRRGSAAFAGIRAAARVMAAAPHCRRTVGCCFRGWLAGWRHEPSRPPRLHFTISLSLTSSAAAPALPCPALPSLCCRTRTLRTGRSTSTRSRSVQSTTACASSAPPRSTSAPTACATPCPQVGGRRGGGQGQPDAESPSLSAPHPPSAPHIPASTGQCRAGMPLLCCPRLARPPRLLTSPPPPPPACLPASPLPLPPLPARSCARDAGCPG